MSFHQPTYLTDSDLLNICKLGKYYYPASNHYGTKETSVVCDRCHREDLKACIGYQNHDLCLNCSAKIIELGDTKIFPIEPINPKRIYPIRSDVGSVTFMVTSMFQPDIGFATKMETSLYKPKKVIQPVTYMVSSMYITNMVSSMYNSN